MVKISKLYLLFALPIFCVQTTGCKNSQPKQESTTPQPASEVTVKKTAPDFNADSAYTFIEKQVSFGPRIPGTPAQTSCANWLTQKMKSFTPDVIVQDVQVALYLQKNVACKNIIGSFNPQAKKRILLCAHWDTRPWSDRDKTEPKKPFDGADDGGSGVAVLLEIARQLKTDQPDVGIDIAFFDVEDYGPPAWESRQEDQNSYCLGTQEWANHPHVPNYRAYYGILLDMVGAKNATFLQEGLSLEYAPSIVKKVWDTGNALGYGNYFSYTKVNGITDDHTFVNSLNQTPCIDIISLDKTSGTGFPAHWHTQQDNMNIIDKNTLKAVGQTLLQVIYSEGPDV